jgi:hypothetical protein
VDSEAHHRWWKETGRAHINRVLRDDWNPIGVNVPDDEYSSYAGTVGRLLREHNTSEQIATFLGTAREAMGLPREEADDQTDREIARSLHASYTDQAT